MQVLNDYLNDFQLDSSLYNGFKKNFFRALEIFYTYGTTKSELLENKNRKMGTSYPLRYKNACMFMLNCELNSESSFSNNLYMKT